MRIANNISAMNTHRVMTGADNQLGKSMERLSSGFRINRAADDAAGLAISEKMRAQVRGLQQASRNAQDGISMIQTAEGGLNETHAILQRMRELAVQANNGTLTVSDKQELQKEINQLVEEVNRISTDTEFNTKKLLNGDAGVKASAQNSVVAGTVEYNGGAVASGDDISGMVKVNAGGGTANGVYAIEIDQSAAAARLSGATGFTTITNGGAGTLTLNNVSVSIAEGDSIGTVISKINNISGQSGVEASDDGGNLVLTTKDVGSTVTISVQGSNALLSDLGLTTGTETALTDAGEDALGTIEGRQAVGSGNKLTDTTTGLSITLDNKLVVATAGTDQLAFDAAVDPNGEVTLQIGANSGQTISFSIGDMGKSALGIDNLDVVINAEGAIDAIDSALELVSAERSQMGAIQNRLEHTISNLGVSAENLTASESRIRDIDMANEMANFTKNQILVQASTAMLAQANQKSQSVLKLLG